MRLNYKVQFILFAICIFFIGFGIYDTVNEELKTGKELFFQISHFIPFVLAAIVFGNNLFSKRIRSFKN